jgi:hypothetical protein
MGNSETTIMQKDRVFRAIQEEIFELGESNLENINLSDLKKALRHLQERKTP